MLARKVRLEMYLTCCSVSQACEHLKVKNSPKNGVVSFKYLPTAYRTSGSLFFCRLVCMFASTKSICLEVYATINVPHEPNFVGVKRRAFDLRERIRGWLYFLRIGLACGSEMETISVRLLKISIGTLTAVSLT
jgi:hypothetical protein